jgi:glycosyltransferase involved in cell wall biosynthesis
MTMTAQRLSSAFDRTDGFRLQREVIVDCASATAVSRRPLKECILWLRGVRRLTWQDRRQSVVRAMTVPPVHEVVSGFASNLATIARGLRTVRTLEALARQPRPGLWRDRPANALYLRTDHWFGLTSGGSVAHTSGVVNGLREIGIDLDLVSTDELSGIAADQRACLVAPQYEGRAIIKGAVELAYNDTLVPDLEHRIAQSRPGFIYQRSSYMNFAGAAMRLRHGIPLVCEFNGPLRWVGKNWDREFDLLGGLSERIETLTLQAADLVVVVSATVRDLAVARGIAADRVLVNPNGVDTGIYRPDIDASALRASLGLDGKIVLGFIGTFGEWHGADKLASAYVKLRTDCPDLASRIHLLMIGDGPTRARAQSVIEQGGAAQAATFTGAVPQAQGPVYLAASDILVSPHVPNPDGSRFFGSPTKLFEYMAMGRGIVASDLDQIGEILSHGDTAWLVKPGDITDLASGLERLVDDGFLRARLGAAAREEAIDRYTWRAHVAHTIDALERVPALGRSSAKAST